MKKRLLFHKLKEHLYHKNALVITGMRQVGKTTLMKQIFEELGEKPKFWFDFDNPLDQKVFEDIEYRNIFLRLKKITQSTNEEERIFIFIDEIQNFPEITKIMKFLIDNYQVKFFVTGSSSFYLKNLFPESLSGRKFLYVLPPMSFQEILYFKDKISLEEASSRDSQINFETKKITEIAPFLEHYNEFLEFGGFPEVVITPEATIKKEILRNIFTSFFEKDLKILSDYKDIKELRDLILLLVPRIGSMLELTKLANELKIDRGKVYSYLEFLQGSFFLRLLPKYSKSVDRSVAGGKKVYICDNGLLNMIGRVNDGQLFENAVVNQLAGFGELHFYNNRNTSEIDLILNKKTALEVKLNGTKFDLEKVEKIAEKLGLTSSYVVSLTPSDENKILSPVAI